MNTALQIPPETAARTDEVTHFGDSAIWTGRRIEDFNAWYHARQGIITASRSAALLRESPFDDPLAVYVSMVAPPAEAPDQKLPLDDPRLWGTVLEWPIAQTVADRCEWQIIKGGALLLSRKYPFMGATLDAEILPANTENWWVYEGKTTNYWRARDWDEETNTPPTHILIQVQHQLLVTGAPGAVVFCLAERSRPLRVNIEPNPEFHAVLIEACEEMLDHVARLDPPPATAQSTALLKALHPTEDGTTVQLPPDAVEWTREVQEIAAQQKALTMRDTELRNLLKQSIGDAMYGELAEEVGGKQRWKWATVNRPSYTVAASSSRTLLCVKAAKQPKRPRRNKKVA